MRRIHRTLALVALALAVLAALALLTLPIEREESARMTPAGQTVRTTRSMTLWQSQGPGVLVPITIPIILVALPLAFEKTRWHRVTVVMFAALLLVFVVLGSPSIGLFYLPAAAVLAVAAILSTRGSSSSRGQALR